MVHAKPQFQKQCKFTESTWLHRDNRWRCIRCKVTAKMCFNWKWRKEEKRRSPVLRNSDGLCRVTHLFLTQCGTTYFKMHWPFKLLERCLVHVFRHVMFWCLYLLNHVNALRLYLSIMFSWLYFYLKAFLSLRIIIIIINIIIIIIHLDELMV